MKIVSKKLGLNWIACRVVVPMVAGLLVALARTTRFTLNGDTLALYSGDGRPILRFRSVHRQ
jgi:hypothetical protein